MAWDWKKVDDPYWRRPHEEVYRALPELLARPGRRALDVGAGLGRHLVYLAENGFDVWGCDLSLDGVAECRQALAPRGLAERVQVADMRALPYPDASFDLVLAINVLYHGTRADLVKALDEVRRVLVPGGLFLGTFNDRRNSSWGNGEQIEPHTFIRADGQEAGIAHHYVSRASLLRLLAGFRPLRLTLKLDERPASGVGRSAHWLVLAERR